jgi:hypothetical protein
MTKINYEAVVREIKYTFKYLIKNSSDLRTSNKILLEYIESVEQKHALLDGEEHCCGCVMTENVAGIEYDEENHTHFTDFDSFPCRKKQNERMKTDYEAVVRELAEFIHNENKYQPAFGSNSIECYDLIDKLEKLKQKHTPPDEPIRIWCGTCDNPVEICDKNKQCEYRQEPYFKEEHCCGCEIGNGGNEVIDCVTYHWLDIEKIRCTKRTEEVNVNE